MGAIVWEMIVWVLCAEKFKSNSLQIPCGSEQNDESIRRLRQRTGEEETSSLP